MDKSQERRRLDRVDSFLQSPGLECVEVAAQARGRDVVDLLRQPAWHWPAAILLAIFFVASSLYISVHRLLWFDEILTALVSRLPNLATMWKALHEVADQTPPLYFLVTRTFDQMFHHSDIGLRVPSALALGVGLLVTFDIARRLTDGLYGLIAMSLLATSAVAYYGYEARSYAIYFMLAAVALWLWAFTKAESKLAAVAFGAVFLVGVAIHYYILLCLIPFGIAAFSDKRIVHWKLMFAALGAALPLATLYPLIASSRAFANSVGPTWAPSISKLVATYLNFLPTSALLSLGVVVIGTVAFGKSRDHLVPSMGAGERVGWLFLVVPCAAYILGQLVTHLFHDRYTIGAAPGMVVGATCLIWRHCRESRFLSLAILLAVGGSAVGQQVRAMRNINEIKADSGEYQERTLHLQSLEEMLIRDGKQHVVLDWDIEYLEAWYYSKHRADYECFTSEKRWAIARYTPLHFVSIAEIVANAKNTALVAPTPALTEALARAGLHLKSRVADSQQIIYLE